MMIFGVIGYAFLIILGAIGIMNLINTMINSIYTRRRELGMIQAIGMSEKQLVHMMQLEGLFYTAGTLLVSLGLGSLAGYGVFLYAKAEYYRVPLSGGAGRGPGRDGGCDPAAAHLRGGEKLPADEPDRPDPVRRLIIGDGGFLKIPRPQWRFSILCGKISA